MAGLNRYALTLTDEQMAAGQHRKRAGHQWDAMGQLQFDFLVGQGLRPQSMLLDVGCGALCGGVHFVRYPLPGERALRRYRREREPARGRSPLRGAARRSGGKLPAANLRATERFECDFPVRFDVALAVFVFTHLPLNHLRLCLYQVGKVTEPGARFFASFFEAPEDTPPDAHVRQLTSTTKPERDPFHYRQSELEWAATVGDWRFRYIGGWQHPKGQRMVEYTRT